MTSYQQGRIDLANELLTEIDDNGSYLRLLKVNYELAKTSAFGRIYPLIQKEAKNGRNN